MFVIRVIGPDNQKWDPIEMPCVPRVGERIQDIHGSTFRIGGVTYVPSGRWKGDRDMWDYDYVRVDVQAA